MDENQLALIALNKINHLGSITIHRLLEKFESPLAVFKQTALTLKQIPYLTTKLIDHMLQLDWKKSAAQELDLAQRYDAKIIGYNQSAFPYNLKSIDYPPPIIYVKGQLVKADERALAVVGTRRPSIYGKQVTKSLVGELTEQSFTIISGLAYGIDGLAHHTALEQQGRTIAVVAHGLDQIYPRGHHYLMQKIINQGAVISEFPFHYPALPHNFPRRNRLISGLAQGVVVIEAHNRSGALITAKWAGEQGREVFAIPGSFFSEGSKGCHHLINDGAKLVSSLEDILGELPQTKCRVASKINKPVVVEIELNAEQHAIIALLKDEIRHIDQISIGVKQPSHQLFSNLLTLEMKGVIIAQPGQLYQLNSSYR